MTRPHPLHHIFVANNIFTHTNSTDPHAFPLHSTVLELSLKLGKILLETLHAQLCFSAEKRQHNVHLTDHEHFRNFLLGAHNLDPRMEAASSAGPVHFDCSGSVCGIGFCTQGDLDEWIKAGEGSCVGKLSEGSWWDFLCIVEGGEEGERRRQLVSQAFGASAARQFHFTTQGQLKQTWLACIKRKYRLIELRIQGIPMKQQKSSDKTDNYEVPLLCHASAYHITRSIASSNLPSIINFSWRRNDPNSNVYAHHMLSDAYPVVPLEPNSNVTKCLLTFIGKGRAATVQLVYDNSDPLNITTHMITSQGNQPYIHLLSPCLMYTPRCLLPASISNNYRSHQLYELIAQKNMIHYHTHLSPFAHTDNIQLYKKAQQATVTMTHNSYTYTAPKYVEKMSRIFPLQYQHNSILWNEQIPPSILHALQPFFKIIYKDKLTEAIDIDGARSFLTTTHRACIHNESALFPHLATDHKKRYYMHKRLWFEVRLLLTAFRIERLLKMMDTLWPQFYYDPEEEAKSVAPRDAHGAPILPFSDEDITIESLGTVVYDRAAFHNRQCIFPVGYRISKQHLDVLDVTKLCTYSFSIQDGGDSPLFAITRYGTPEHAFQGRTAQSAYRDFANTIERIQGGSLSSVSEKDSLHAFGLSKYSVLHLISELPNADKCRREGWPFSYASTRPPLAALDSGRGLKQGVSPGDVNGQGNGSTAHGMGTPRRNASDNTSVTFALQTQFVYLHQRDVAAAEQKKHIESLLSQLEWNEGDSFVDLHNSRLRTRLEERTRILGSKKELFEDPRHSEEGLLMDAIIPQQQQLSSTRKKKQKKRKSQSEGKRGSSKRRRK